MLGHKSQSQTRWGIKFYNSAPVNSNRKKKREREEGNVKIAYHEQKMTVVGRLFSE